VPRPIATFALALTLPLLYPWALRAQSSIAITGATLLDGTGTAPVTDAAVIVRDGRITCAGPGPSCPVPKGARRIDARGTWLIPGLVDAHVHFSQTGWFDGRPDAADLRERYP
jgi:imidazolonepropionase-like amidohydrolase